MNINQALRGFGFGKTDDVAKTEKSKKGEEVEKKSEDGGEKGAPKTDSFSPTKPEIGGTGMYSRTGEISPVEISVAEEVVVEGKTAKETIDEYVPEEEIADESSNTEEAGDSLKTAAKNLVEAHEENQSRNMTNMLYKMLGQQISATKSEMTTDATYNVSEEGAYGVGAVADNIMNLALAMAGDDPELLAELKEAVIKGFEMAGLEFDEDGNATGLPGVCIDTFNEVMNRFDYATENGNSLDGYVYTAYDGSGRTATLTGNSDYSTRDNLVLPKPEAE